MRQYSSNEHEYWIQSFDSDCNRCIRNSILYSNMRNCPANYLIIIGKIREKMIWKELGIDYGYWSLAEEMCHRSTRSSANIEWTQNNIVNYENSKSPFFRAILIDLFRIKLFFFFFNFIGWIFSWNVEMSQFFIIIIVSIREDVGQSLFYSKMLSKVYLSTHTIHTKCLCVCVFFSVGQMLGGEFHVSNHQDNDCWKVFKIGRNLLILFFFNLEFEETCGWQ